MVNTADGDVWYSNRIRIFGHVSGVFVAVYTMVGRGIERRKVFVVCVSCIAMRRRFVVVVGFRYMIVGFARVASLVLFIHLILRDHGFTID